MKTPVIVLNVKAYTESTGERGLLLAEACEELTEKNGVNTMICPQMVDLSWIAKQVKIPCLAQHVDAIDPGSHTGWVSLESIKESGAAGSLVNHSEHRMKISDIDFIIKKAKDLDLLTIVCTNNVNVSASIAALKPHSIAVEPPELIGTGISVSKADPEVVEGTVKAVKNIHRDTIVLCGAGITNGEDVRAAIELGAEGVLLASGVVKAKDPKAVLLDLASGI
ncbi:MAG: triose-phosphate isomerase [Candidatus Syntropharchaeia archaeon]